MRERVEAFMSDLHDEITTFVERLDRGKRFREDCWQRPGGGGGVTRVLTEGATFEKAGVNRSAVEGAIDAHHARRLGAVVPVSAGLRFHATGVSVVLHPRSPMVPTVHLNVRCFEIAAPDGIVLDRWFGGGTDLTPYYPFPDDAVHFHRVLRNLCDAHDRAFYPRFKAWCDQYFVNAHRGHEARGIGGIFFDNLRPGRETALDAEQLFAFVRDVGRVLPDAYGPIVERRRDAAWGERERRLQLLRRGRYVEFNLVHDRGTLFGLQTNARIESVLMSLPPVAMWDYDPVFEPGSFEQELMAMLRPRDWLDGED
ncbi:MAG: oxygen-dependent coproporphyrinogen oxidase [Gemmatimonadota bacterium]